MVVWSDEGVDKNIDHNRVSGASGPPAQPEEELLKKYYLNVQLRARYHGIVIRDLALSAEAERPRQQIPQAAFGEIHDASGSLVAYAERQQPDLPSYSMPSPPDPNYGAAAPEGRFNFCNGDPLKRKCPSPIPPQYACQACTGPGPQ